MSMNAWKKSESLALALTQAGIPYCQNERMQKHTTFAIGGEVSLYVTPTDRAQMIKVLRQCCAHGVPYIVLGRGSNVLFSDAPFVGAVISTAALCEVRLQAPSPDGSMQYLTAECGASLRSVACEALSYALEGAEFLHGIPGSVGGAIRMNAGAFGGEIGALVQQIVCYNVKTDGFEVFSQDAFAFGNRHSLLTDRPELVCLEATLALPRASQEEAASVRDTIAARMDEYKRRRRSTQPLEYPSAGSVFKRPMGSFAGKLIEDCGLKGAAVGGACVSEKHAGFIINRDHATAEDVCTLIARVQKEVQAKFGVALEREIILCGFGTDRID